MSRSQSKGQFIEPESQSHYKHKVKIVEPKLLYYLNVNFTIPLLKPKIIEYINSNKSIAGYNMGYKP